MSDCALHDVLHRTGSLQVLQVCPDAAEIQDRIAQAAAGRKWRPIVVLAIDAAEVPSRPQNAKGTRPGRKKSRARRRGWQGEYREAKGFRFYLVDDERIVHFDLLAPARADTRSARVRSNRRIASSAMFV